MSLKIDETYVCIIKVLLFFIVYFALICCRSALCLVKMINSDHQHLHRKNTIKKSYSSITYKNTIINSYFSKTYKNLTTYLFTVFTVLF